MPRMLTDGKSRVDAQRMRVTYIYALLAFATLSAFGTLQILVEGKPVLGYLELAASFAILLTTAGLKLTRNISLASHLILLAILVMLLVMLLTGGTANTGLLWVFLFPVSAFFLTNKKTGLWWMLALFAVIGFVMIASHYDLVATPYSLITLRQLLISLVVVAIGIYVYQKSREAITQEAQQSSLASKEDRIKADIIIDNIGEGVVAVDTKGQVVLINKVAADMLGWETLDLKGEVFADVVPMIDAAGSKVSPSENPFIRTLKEKDELRLDTTYLRKDGSAFTAEITCKAITIDGEVHGVIGTLRDTTAEHAIDRTKTEFVTLASHQLRTPISAISWVAELLLHGDGGELTPEQSDYVQQIYQSNKRMAALVDAMLTASTLELGNLPLHPEDIDLTKISRDALKKQFETLPAHKILHIKEKYDPNLENVQFDANVIKTILQNLVANAFKYTPSDGTITITIIITSGDELVLEVSDTGIGIPLRQQSKIFTRLFRADNIKHQDTDGTGLGLYIVKMMAEYVGGHVTFTSKENSGSTFTVHLPLHDTSTKEGKSS